MHQTRESDSDELDEENFLNIARRSRNPKMKLHGAQPPSAATEESLQADRISGNGNPENLVLLTTNY